MNRLKNGLILIILISFLCFVAIMPVTCIFKTVTGICCPACGMTRAFLAIFHLDFLSSIWHNILGIPLFIFLIYSIAMLVKDFIKNRFDYITNVLNFLTKHYILILILLCISFLFNNLKQFFLVA